MIYLINLTITYLLGNAMPYSERFLFLVMPSYYLKRITEKSKLHESPFIFTSNITLRIRTSDMTSFRFFSLRTQVLSCQKRRGRNPGATFILSDISISF